MHNGALSFVAISAFTLLSACAAGPAKEVTRQEKVVQTVSNTSAEARRRLQEAAQLAVFDTATSAAVAAEAAAIARQEATDLSAAADLDPSRSDEAIEAAEKADALQEVADQLAEEAEETVEQAGDVAGDAPKGTGLSTAARDEFLKGWQGWGFGVALSTTFDAGGEDRIEAVSLDEADIVRVDKETNVLARLGLELHYFGDCLGWLGRIVDPWIGEGDCGIGPFVAVQPGQDEIIDAVGFGIMTGFKRPGRDNNNSFNIGLGAIVDPNVTVLGTDVRENEPLPAGETEIRTREENQWGILLLFSFAFN